MIDLSAPIWNYITPAITAILGYVGKVKWDLYIKKDKENHNNLGILENHQKELNNLGLVIDNLKDELTIKTNESDAKNKRIEELNKQNIELHNKISNMFKLRLEDKNKIHDFSTKLEISKHKECFKNLCPLREPGTTESKNVRINFKYAIPYVEEELEELKKEQKNHLNMNN